MAIEEVGANPVRLAEAIHSQLGDRAGAVPVADIARALDIDEIRIEPLTNFEGALVAPPERGFGAILVNQRSNARRRRFTIGHELLHFLNPHHEPTSAEGFRCSQKDMTEKEKQSTDRHRRQEAEANTFAIELLIPKKRLRSYLGGGPDLAVVLSIADRFDVSREAAARRYVTCHSEMLAAVFARNGQFLYYEAPTGFPGLALRSGAGLPLLFGCGEAGTISEMREADPDEWLARSDGMLLTEQTLYQQEGFSTTLLHITKQPDDDENKEEVEDTYERFVRS